jgi:hypothetical protein
MRDLDGLIAELRRRRVAPALHGCGVADFADATGDPKLDGLSVFLGPALGHGGAFRVVGRSAMADADRQPGISRPERIDQPVGRAAASPPPAVESLSPVIDPESSPGEG